MQKANCLIIDDEPLARKLMAAYCAKIPQLEVVGQAASAMDAQFVLHQKQVDIMLLDIQMPDLTGPDFLRSITQPPLVIFTTAYSEYALQVLNWMRWIISSSPSPSTVFLKPSVKLCVCFNFNRRKPMPNHRQASKKRFRPMLMIPKEGKDNTSL